MNKDIFIELVAFQTEGINQVFDTLEAGGFDSITLSPFFFEETGDPDDLRLPPLDKDGASRTLDRPLWNGEKVKYGKNHLLFQPNASYYGKSPYLPPWRDDAKDLCAQVIKEARKRDIKVNLLIPGNPTLEINDKDYPRNWRNQIQIPLISFKGCINAPDIREYYLGSVKNLIERYEPEGIFIDWIEYTNYRFSDNLVCFCDHCRQQARERGRNFDSMIRSAERVIEWIRGVENVPDVTGAGWDSIWETMGPGIMELFQFKAESIRDFVEYISRSIPGKDHPDRDLIFPGFAPPMNRGTGFHYALLASAGPSIVIQPKAYRFHWGMMVKWYAEELSEINGRIPAGNWIPFAKELLEIDDDSSRPDHFVMPRPDEEGPVSLECEWRKMDEALEELKKVPPAKTLSYRLHSYGPVSLFEKRWKYVRRSGFTRADIQRYGYMGDKKITLAEKSE